MIHVQYRRLQKAREQGIGGASIRAGKAVVAIDEAMQDFFRRAKQQKIKLIGDDRAERVAEAMAVALIDSDEDLKEIVEDWGND